ncbi:MAG TPA: DapH/DapD/GlmU-related protein, partial [bacterium]|nr:DapH/DapD/GlmU-related protein [bacterium]
DAGATVRYSVVDSSVVGAGAKVGPYAHLRGGAVIGPECRVGNFVEIKKSKLGAGAKASHLSYLGDATVGPKANIGAGTITCNYDGVNKHPTVIGEGAFIGSDSILVAPVTIGERSMTAAGSVITDDVPPDHLAFGRARQINKNGRVLQALKARQRTTKETK